VKEKYAWRKRPESAGTKIIWWGCRRLPYARRLVLKGAGCTRSSVCSALLKSRLHLSTC